jgi:hypothetical protein
MPSMGAEGRYEDWVYLQLLEREWNRPVTETEHIPGFDLTQQPSSYPFTADSAAKG